MIHILESCPKWFRVAIAEVNRFTFLDSLVGTFLSAFLIRLCTRGAGNGHSAIYGMIRLQAMKLKQIGRAHV